MSTIAKLVYSVLLLGLSGVLLRELWTVWFDRTIYVGRFDVVSEAGKDDTASAAFPKRIVSAHAILARQFQDYQTRRAADAPSDATYVLPGMTPLLLPPEVLAGIDITVQNVNLRQVLTALRKAFLAPNEVVGNIVVREGAVLGAVDWPRAPGLAGREPALTNFLVPRQTSAQGAAAYIASSLAWARAATLDPHVAGYPRAQFCDFGAALTELYALSEKASSPSGLDANESALVRKRAAQLRSHYGAEVVFPELYRLRADLLDLVPEKERKQGELVEAQEDRLRYAMLSPKLRELPEEEKRLAALALARPAIPIENGKLVAPAENWAGLLNRREAEVRAAADVTGVMVTAAGTPVGTGFIVAPGLMMTADHVLDLASDSHPTGEAGQKTGGKIRFCLGAKAAACETSLAVGEVVYLGKAQGSRVVLVNLVDPDTILHPPLQFAAPLPAANTLIGQYAFVVGYPFRDPRMPAPFIERLLGGDDGRKRLMPGRVLGFGKDDPVGGVELERASRGPGVFVTDISTSGGTAGAPLVDLTTGRVLGMSYGGVWKGERGKFAYAEAIPDEALALIGRRLRGEPDQPEQTTPIGESAGGKSRPPGRPLVESSRSPSR